MNRIPVITVRALSVVDAKLVTDQFVRDSLNRRDNELSAEGLRELVPRLLHELLRYLSLKMHYQE